MRRKVRTGWWGKGKISKTTNQCEEVSVWRAEMHWPQIGVKTYIAFKILYFENRLIEEPMGLKPITPNYKTHFNLFELNSFFCNKWNPNSTKIDVIGLRPLTNTLLTNIMTLWWNTSKSSKNPNKYFYLFLLFLFFWMHFFSSNSYPIL